MANALFITISGAGRINPTLPLVKALIGRGENVTYISTEAYREKIEATGASFWSLANTVTVKDETLPMVPMRAINAILDLIFKAEQPFDYLVYDSNFIIGDEVGRALNLPTICSITTFAANPTVDIFNVAQHYERNIERLSTYSAYTAFVKRLKDLYGINFPSVLTAAAPVGMLKLVYTSRYFQLFGDAFDDSYKFIGPSIEEAAEQEAFVSSLKKDHQRLIYISLGTIYNESIAFYNQCMKAFSDFDATVIMSVGQKVDISTLKDIPSHFVIKNHVDQLAVLRQADVFMTHAGMNSTNEALYHHVPLLLLPQAGDQPFVAKQVASLGAGVMLDQNQVSPETLRSAVLSLLSNEMYKVNSRKIGESLRVSGGFQRGADEILSFYASHSCYQSVK